MAEMSNEPPEEQAEGSLPLAIAQMMNDCEEQFLQMEQLQNEIILCEPDSCENPQEQPVNRLMATDAELKQWMTMEPKMLPTNSEMLLHAGKEEMLRLCSHLEMIVSCEEAKRDKLRESKNREEAWLEGNTQVLKSATDHVERLKLKSNRDGTETKDKIKKQQDYLEKLQEALMDVLDEHFPLPELEIARIPLNKILEKLMNKMHRTPHDPYVTIDKTFWPPYIETLLRYGIAVRHKENHLKIRLETFF